GLVAAYGQIIKQETLDKFNGQIYNIHPSLLPKYRGPSPLQEQVLDGIVETGVTIIQLDALLDHGPIVAVAHDKISPDDTTETLGNRLFEKGANLFLNLLNTKHRTPNIQNEADASFTKKLTRQDGFVPWEQFQPEKLDRQFRAFYNWPGIWTTTPNGQRLKLIAIKPEILVQLEGKTVQHWPIQN
ncbi:MAG: formyltransferase family protein, partial [Patescibacteria group bacterium]